jgi:hypothetical protein
MTLGRSSEQKTSKLVINNNLSRNLTLDTESAPVSTQSLTPNSDAHHSALTFPLSRSWTRSSSLNNNPPIVNMLLL